ncbi:MAG: nicotinate-nucleotide adenylyltransferase [Deltaproteobacteria bacterium]|nr:nicotinate-nucleotide adenylyltransferase [Deltaproteobacteria bacterium]
MQKIEYKTGVIHGRFQILHNDHIKYLVAGKKMCRHLVVGITNPDPFLTRQEDADPNRNAPQANPLTYYERYVMVGSALDEAGVSPREFSIVPFPINLPDLYKYYVPMDAVFFLSIYDEWGKKKLSMFKAQGLETNVLWEVPPEKKGISASDVRAGIKNGEPWEHLVPPSVSELIKKWNIVARLKA